MEIVQYWRAAGPLRWGLLVVPVLAAAVALLLVWPTAAQQRAVATVVIPQGTNQPGPALVRQQVADLRALLDSDPVRSSVAEATGLTEAELDRAIVTRQVGEGAVIEVVATGQGAQQMEALAETLGAEGIRVLLDGDVEAATRATDLAREAYDQARAETEAWLDERELDMPPGELATALSEELLALRSEARAVAADPVQAAAIELRISETEERLDELADLRRAYEPLAQELSATESALQSAQQAQLSAEARRPAAPQAQVSVAPARAVSRIPAISQAVVGAAGLAIVVVLAGLLLVGLLRSGALRGAPAATSPPATDDEDDLEDAVAARERRRRERAMR